MMRKIFTGALVLLTIVVSSCNKWLDLQPQDGITKQEFWKTKEDVRAALTGIYAGMVGGGVEESIFLWGEMRADMIALTPNASEDFRQVRNSNILSTNRISYWGSIYKIINDCNLLIDFAGEAKALDPTFTTEQFNSYVGEALTIRSLMYFYLVRTFRDIPLKLKGSYKDSDVKELGKTGSEEVLNQIVADLTKAKTMVPATHSSSNQINKGRITKYAVYALMADVFLWKEQYSEAVMAADSVLNNKDFRLLTATSGWFASVFEQGSSSETIFELSHRTSLENVFARVFLNQSRRLITASDHVSTNIFIANLQVDANLVDGRNVFFNTSGNIVKYGDGENNGLSSYNFPIYRISDVMLIKAEALNQLEKGEEALEIVQEIRESRGALAATNPGVGPDDKDGINLFILEERAREFAFEGKRWFDLLRNAKRNNYADFFILTDLITTISDASVQQSALSKIRDYDSHYLPILESELFADTKLVQNPFYVK